MGQLSKEKPKQMLEIVGYPKLAWTLSNLPEGIDEVFLIVGYLKEKIIDYFGDFYGGKKIKYLEQKELNGSAGAIALAKKFIDEGEKFLVLMGDDFYLKSDLEKMLKEDWALLAYETNEAENYGLVSTDKNNFLKGVIERPHNFKKGLVNTGAYILQKDYFKVPMVRISEKEFGLPQTMIKMSEDLNIPIKVLKTKKWLPIGNPEALKLAQEKVKEFDYDEPEKLLKFLKR